MQKKMDEKEFLILSYILCSLGLVLVSKKMSKYWDTKQDAVLSWLKIFAIGAKSILQKTFCREEKSAANQDIKNANYKVFNLVKYAE